MLEVLVPNCGIETVENINPEETEGMGRRCKVPKTKTYRKAQKEQSFQVEGPTLFNSLPQSVRNITKCSVEYFKQKLDDFLTNIPDEPKIGGLIPGASDQLTSGPYPSKAKVGLPFKL